MEKIRVRIAPSPTGFLHIGTARTALYNWLFARNKGGKFILRIEDTDIERSSPPMVEVIIDSLRWLGLNWDEGPYFQSQRVRLYREYAQRLLTSRNAYYCYCSEDELGERREVAKKEKKDWKYNRRCLKLTPQQVQEFEAEGRFKALRFLVPKGKTQVDDLVCGQVEKENSDIEDLIILRSDGRPTYNFACVVDDLEMRITHVIRGNDHLSNTFKQILIYKALGSPPPRFAHLPLGLGEDRSKISKRHGAVSVTEYRKAGFLPEALTNYLALLGWSPGDDREIMSREELVEAFSLERVSPRNPIFDLQKLEWMNGQYINRLEEEDLLRHVLLFLQKKGWFREDLEKEKREWLKRVLMLLKERAHKLTDFVDLGSYFFSPQIEYDPQAVRQYLRVPGTKARMLLLRDRLVGLEDFTADTIEAALRALAEELGVKAARLIHPLRVAATGRKVGPSLFHLLELLGQERVLERLEDALSLTS